MRITKITIGRLFNLGSYEHVRYELSADVGESESVETAVIGLEKVLAGLNPKRPSAVKSRDEIDREIRRLAEMRALNNDDFERFHGGYKDTREEYLERISKGIADDETKLRAWQERSQRARELLDDLGAASVWTDAKQSWEDDW